MTIIPRVIDTSHYTTIDDLSKTGLWGVIAKSTQGTTRVDPKYAKTRQQTEEAELLFGAYHFNSGDDVEQQVDFFIENAKPDSNTLMAIDFEHNEASHSASNMSIQQLVEFLSYAEKQLGRKLVIYSGNYLKESIDRLAASDQLYVCSHKLWLAHYNANPRLPDGFDSWWLHQYTGDNVGPRPHSVPGISGEAGLDLNQYNGTLEQLTQEWAS